MCQRLEGVRPAELSQQTSTQRQARNQLALRQRLLNPMSLVTPSSQPLSVLVVA
jgi:hypothetical protein